MDGSGGVLMDAETARWMGAWMHEWMGSFPQVAEPSFWLYQLFLQTIPFPPTPVSPRVFSGFEHPLLGAEVREKKLLCSQSSEEGLAGPSLNTHPVCPGLPGVLITPDEYMVWWWPLFPVEGCSVWCTCCHSQLSTDLLPARQALRGHSQETSQPPQGTSRA